jgi:hypothetical protein
MALDFENGVLFRAADGSTELFDCPLSRRSARDVARLLARRWHADVALMPCCADGGVLDHAVDAVTLEPSRRPW